VKIDTQIRRRPLHTYNFTSKPSTFPLPISPRSSICASRTGLHSEHSSSGPVTTQKRFAYPWENFPVRLGIHWHFTWCPTPKKTKHKPSRGNLLSTSNAGLIPFQLARLSLTLLFRLRWLLFESSTSQSTCAAERTSLRLVSSNKTVSWGLWT
jgi:hypothetical protein